MTGYLARAREARNLAELYEKQEGHALTVQILREHAELLESYTNQAAPEVLQDATRYRRLAVMPNNEWVSFNIPSSDPAFALEPHNRKPFLDALLD